MQYKKTRNLLWWSTRMKSRSWGRGVRRKAKRVYSGLEPELIKDTKYAHVTPIKKVKIKTPDKSTNELNMYSKRKVFFKIIE